jgi:hypothetical protein
MPGASPWDVFVRRTQDQGPGLRHAELGERLLLDRRASAAVGQQVQAQVDDRAAEVVEVDAEDAVVLERRFQPLDQCRGHRLAGGVVGGVAREQFTVAQPVLVDSDGNSTESHSTCRLPSDGYRSDAPVHRRQGAPIQGRVRGHSRT